MEAAALVQGYQVCDRRVTASRQGQNSPTKKPRSNGGSPLPSKPSTPTPEQQPERSVWVAVRARPLVCRERLEGAKTCISVDQAAGTVRLGTYRQFNYDHAFGPAVQQQDVFSTCVSGLVDAVVQGYNATVLAYGPTGSGKTFTMGMGSARHSMQEQQGIIPRVIRQLFSTIAAAPSSSSFVVKAQFLEIYNEELRDLLTGVTQQDAGSSYGGGSPSTAVAAATSSPTQLSLQRNISIRECPDGQIIVTGAREVTAAGAEELLRLLDAGTLTRATSSTLLNQQSSRSHAIFTIIVEQTISSVLDSSSGAPCSGRSSSPLAIDSSRDTDSPSSGATRGDDCMTTDSTTDVQHSLAVAMDAPLEYRCAKFHLVDLAGSERASRSGAAGVRLREAVNINQGLLALGNVISALSDTERRPGRHVPYRDSKLTRLLQDSLGGNSKTLLIACVSSADDAVEESLNTLKYGARARFIRNRPMLNKQCLYKASRSLAAEIQAHQLLLLRRLVQQLLGPQLQAGLPEVLMEDAADADASNDCGTGDPVQFSLKMLQELKAMASKADPMQFVADASHSSDQLTGLSPLAWRLADVEAKLSSANTHIMRLELHIDVCTAEQEGLEQAATVLQEQQSAGWDNLLQQIEQLHTSSQLTDTARQVLHGAATLHQQQISLQSLAAHVKSGTEAPRRAYVHSYPLPEAQSSCSDAVNGAGTGNGRPGTGVDGSRQVEELSQQVVELRAALAEKDALLALAKGDLSKDEKIFSEKVKQAASLQAQLESTEESAQVMTARLYHLQAELRRWRARALALQACSMKESQQQDRPVLPAPPQSPSMHACPSSSPAAGGQLQQELSFAADASKLGDQLACVFQDTPQEDLGSCVNEQHCASKTPQDAADKRSHLVLSSSTDLQLQDLQTDAFGVAGVFEDDQVLFDAELASYISDTDYTDLHCADLEANNHLLAELQVLLADKAALEEEKASALAEAAAAQRAFEHSRAMLEGQLGQLSSAITSQEALIATLQANETEAKSVGALYLERCRELEAELADLSLDLQELTAALAKVEANAAATAEEKQKLRKDYEGKIESVVQQMAELQEQMKQQDAARLDKERQRAAGRIQQLQAELSSMRTQQETLRRRLQERLTSQEKDAAIKSRELASLRRAAETARKRVSELEEENKRQRAALQARINEAAAAKRQLRELGSRASPARSRPGQSPKASPRSQWKAPHAAASLRVATQTSPRTPNCRKPLAWVREGGDVSPKRQPGCASNHAKLVGLSGCGDKSSTCSSLPDLADKESTKEQGVISGDHPAGLQGTCRTEGSSDSSSSSSSGKQLLTKEVQLLVSEYTAKHRLQLLQVKHAAVLSRRDELLAATAQLELKQLRRAQSAGADTGRQSRESSTDSCQGAGCSLNPTEQVLLSDYTDQLDAANAQLDHIQELMHKAAAEAASAADGASHLLSTTSSMTGVQLQELLRLAFKELALQATECQETMNQAKQLQLELTDLRQQLQETTCCLQTVQLQHQAQLAELQREHELRALAWLRKQPDAAAGGSCVQSAAMTLKGLAPPTPQGIQQDYTQSKAHQHQSSSRLMDLLHLLAQQGNAEQRQKLLGTLNRLQQLQHAQDGQQHDGPKPLQQLCAKQQQQQQQQHQQQQPCVQADNMPAQQLQQHHNQQPLAGDSSILQQAGLAQQQPVAELAQSELPVQPQLHCQQGLQQQPNQQQPDQLLRLKQHRAQQRLHQQQHWQPSVQCGTTVCCHQQQEQQLQHTPEEHQLAPEQHKLVLRQPLTAQAASASSLQPCRHVNSVNMVSTPQQQQGVQQQSAQQETTHIHQPKEQAGLHERHASSTQSVKSTSSDTDDCDGCSIDSSGSDCHHHTLSGGGSSSSRASVGQPARLGSAAGGARDNSLRASASRLQAKLCSYHVHTRTQQASERQSSPTPGNTSLRCSSTGGWRGRQTSSSDSPRCSLQAAVAAALAARDSCHRRSSVDGSMLPTCVNSVVQGQSPEASPTAAMLRKAAHLAMSSSMELARWSSTTRLVHKQAAAGSPGLAAAGSPCSSHTPSEASRLNQSVAFPCGIFSSNSSSNSQSCRASGDSTTLCAASDSGCAQQPVIRHCPEHSSRDCTRPASLDVGLEQSSGCQVWGSKQKSPAAGTLGVLDASSPITDNSYGRDTSKRAGPCGTSCLDGVAAAVSGTGGALSPAAMRGLKSPLQQYKASAAAAVGRDQQQLAPGSPGHRSRGVSLPLTSPKAYTKLLQGVAGPK